MCGHQGHSLGPVPCAGNVQALGKSVPTVQMIDPSWQMAPHSPGTSGVLVGLREAPGTPDLGASGPSHGISLPRFKVQLSCFLGVASGRILHLSGPQSPSWHHGDSNCGPRWVIDRTLKCHLRALGLGFETSSQQAIVSPSRSRAGTAWGEGRVGASDVSVQCFLRVSRHPVSSGLLAPFHGLIGNSLLKTSRYQEVY